MVSNELLIKHDEPLWATRADSVVAIDLTPWQLRGVEQIASRHVGGSMYEMCCIPFFSYGFRLGDIVEVEAENEMQPFARRVVKPANRLNVRLVVSDERETESAMRRVTGILRQAQCGYEIWKPGYVAADVPSSESEQMVLNGLRALTDHGILSIERI